MIYCSALNIIFIKTKKVGGTSFEIALSKYCNPNDIVTPISNEDEKIREQFGFQSPVNFLDENRSKSLTSKNVKGHFRNHMSSRSIHKKIGKEIFNSATKISIQRDPLDFLISMYYYELGRRVNKNTCFKTWLSNNYRKAKDNYLIAPLSGKYSPDIILTYERLKEDIMENQIFPNDFIKIFESINAKGGYRKQTNISSLEFFKINNCEDLIPKILALKKSTIFDYPAALLQMKFKRLLF